MITIFKHRKDIPNTMEYVELNDVFFNQNTASRLDERATDIIQEIDHSKMVSKYKICSRFNDIVLDVDQLSTGCKTILNVLYFPDKVFCLKECGDNVLEVLYRLKDGYVYSSYPLIPFDLKSVMVQDNNGKRQIDDYNGLKEWWENEK